MNINKLRRAKKMTMHELGQKIGKSHQAIWNYEHGYRDINLSTAVKIAKALGCKVDDLIDDDTEGGT